MKAYLAAYHKTSTQVAELVGTYRQRVDVWAQSKQVLVTCDDNGVIESIESLKVFYKRDEK